MLKVGMVGKWHVHAEGYARTVKATGKADIVAVWDDDEARGSAWAKDLGCAYYRDLDELLAQVDAIVVCSATTQHYDIIKKAVAAGKDVFTEKVLAPTVKECEELADLIEKAGITFTISLPDRFSPAIVLAKDMIKRGAFGKISTARVRNGHEGLSTHSLPSYWMNEDEAAGGAMMDLGCHPMYLANWLFGKPKKINAMMSAPFGSSVDEAATVTIEMEDGVVYTAETSLISYKSPALIEIYGTDATLIAVDDDVKVYSREFGAYGGQKKPYAPVMPEKRPIPLVYFIEACVNKTGTPAEFGPREGVELTRLLENAYIADREKKTVIL